MSILDDINDELMDRMMDILDSLDEEELNRLVNERPISDIDEVIVENAQAILDSWSNFKE